MQRELTLSGVEQLRSQSSERESEVSFVTIGTRATSEIIAPMQSVANKNIQSVYVLSVLYK